jgi:hypothetical protein
MSEKMVEDKISDKKRFRCSNPDCGKAFDKPKIIMFCPYCYTEVKKAEVMKEKTSGCPHFFGYLGLKEDGKGIPEECNECTKTLECLLKKRKYSNKAVKEIKKWF